MVKQATNVVMHTGAGNLLNAILDAVLIFPLGLGVSGAALATVTSEYVGRIVIFLAIKLIFLIWSIFASSYYHLCLYNYEPLNNLDQLSTCIQVLYSIDPSLEAE
jgi:Na+-driven multidrug efflux pump